VSAINEPANASAVINHLPAHAARTLAVEILLSDVEWLHDDVMESCLYLLRDRLTEAPQDETGDHPRGN
jgi:hypothetical protein